MCGIFGAFGWTAFPPEALQRALDQMAPRGPDDQGQWTAPGTCLGHRRLAILDLDHRAAQPMPDATGRYVISFNGEIYNCRDLRRQLEHTGVAFRTTSDTEVILALFAAEAAVQALEGFSTEDWVHEMVGSVPRDHTLALAQIESLTYLRNQLLRDSD